MKKSIVKYHKIFDDFARVTQLLPTPIYWLDINAVLAGCNEHFYQLLGINSDYIGVTGYDVYPYDIAHHIVEHDKMIMQTGMADSQEEPTIDIITGRQRYFNAFKTPVRNENGDVIGLVGTLIEITDTKEKEHLKIEHQANKAVQEAQFRKTVAQAHDISSPLAALQMVVPHCDVLPENTRTVLNKSAVRIADIAENFLSQFKPKDEDIKVELIRAPTLISAEVLEILTEKKYEYSKLSLEFSSNISQSGAFAFINVDQRAFKRMLSNLINNSVDACEGLNGRVIIHLHEIDNQVQITIEDNGKGMPEVVKEKILNNIQITSGKEDGHGIGFTQIRDTLANNEGKLSIESIPNAGTKVILTFPKITTPDWMAESIVLNQDDLVVILDDDESIHDAWETRFEKSASQIKRQHFKQGNEALEFINNLSRQEQEQVFLLTDYELLKQDLNGLNVIEKTGLSRSILVTSHHNNPDIRAQAKHTNTKILPKPLAPEIQINISYIYDMNKTDILSKENILKESIKNINISTYKNIKLNYNLDILNDLERIAPFIPFPIYWGDAVTIKVLGANQECLKAMGAKVPSDVIGKTPYDYYPKEIAEKIIAHAKLVIDSRMTLTTEDIIQDITTGQIRYYSAIKAPLFDDNGIAVAILGVSIEITEKKEIEQKLAASQERFQKLSAQVAHDISSPLAALQMVLPHCSSLPENTRNVLNKSAIRIADIAENFLSQFKPKDEDIKVELIRVPTLISAEVLEILTEKKYEYSKLSLEFSSNISQSGAFAFINVDQRAFKRMLSNLINNSVDACESLNGRVIIHLHEIDNQVQITIEDNGKGMPEAVIEKILNNIQITSGKEDGHGIGFTQIRDTLANNEGKLAIESIPNAGTKVILTFPKITTPDWMAENIELHQDDVLIILDDDDSIHGAWETRFEKSAPDIKRNHFKQGNEVVEFINNLSLEEKSHIFLLTDYELLRQDLNGLDVIEKTGLSRSILVTSHHNNLDVRAQAKHTNTKILPKPLASEIIISISHDERLNSNNKEKLSRVDLVILDDDKNLIDAILMFAIDEDTLVDKYYAPQELLDNLTKYPKETRFLIDNQYKGEAITGLEIVKKLHELGYTNLNLFSGEYFDKDSGIPDYLNVISKNDPSAVSYLLKNT